MDDLLAGLNEDQKKAVLINDGSLLVFAGAGSGKTRVITTKIAYAVRQGIFRPDEILAVTFTNKACDEMRTRVSLMAGESDSGRIMIKTFHSFGLWLMREFPLAAGLEPDFQMYDEADCRSMLCQCFPDEPKKTVGGYADEIAVMKDRMEKPSSDDPLKVYYDAYQKRLRETNHIDFADMILKPIDAILTDDTVKNYLHGRFRMILVDEYQDSNKAQALLLRLVAGPDAFVCVVGDDDQSIYAFRGADVGNILDFRKTFRDVRTVTLGTNYRCTARILEVAKDVISNNTMRVKKRLSASRQDGKLPEVYSFKDEYAEADFVVSTIREKGEYNRTAIEYRNNWLSKLFEEKLMKEHIPYHIVGNVGFYDREEVRDAMALICLCLNPRDAVAFRRMVNKPPKGIGDRTAMKVIEAAQRHGMDIREGIACVAGEMKQGSKARLALEGFADMIADYSDPEDFSDNISWLHRLLKASGILEMYAQQDEEERTQRSGNLSQLVSSFGDPRFRYGKEGISAFLEDVALTRNATKDKGGGVTLITMHSTKGLEFDRVFVVGMEDGIMPTLSSGLSDEEALKEMEEERRLCYVAFTRAKDELYITRSESRRIYGQFQIQEPSPFLSEIKPEHVRHPMPERSRGFGYSDLYGGGAGWAGWRRF